MFLCTFSVGLLEKLKSRVAHIDIATGQQHSEVFFKHNSQSELFEMSDLFSLQAHIPQRLSSSLGGKSQSFPGALGRSMILSPQLLSLPLPKASPVSRTSLQAPPEGFCVYISSFTYKTLLQRTACLTSSLCSDVFSNALYH